MSRKNKKQKKPRTPVRFAKGAQVRVKPGTTDPDFPDIPLGGWAGTIREVNQRSAPPTYLVEWNRHTLENMYPVYRKRCERDGLELESMWLGEDDIDPDSGGPAIIEQPANIVTRPLNEKDQDDRVRIALGLTSDDPLAAVDEDTLLSYHHYLAAHLTFPFEAKYEPEYGPSPTIKIMGLSDPKVEPGIEEMYGLFCEARVEGRLIEVPLAECKRMLRPGGRIVVVAVSKEGNQGVVVSIFEWAHKHFPNLMDCRPIYVRRALEVAGFTIKEADVKSMWVPVEIVLAVKG